MIPVSSTNFTAPYLEGRRVTYSKGQVAIIHTPTGRDGVIIALLAGLTPGALLALVAPSLATLLVSLLWFGFIAYIFIDRIRHEAVMVFDLAKREITVIPGPWARSRPHTVKCANVSTYMTQAILAGGRYDPSGARVQLVKKGGTRVAVGDFSSATHAHQYISLLITLTHCGVHDVYMFECAGDRVLVQVYRRSSGMDYIIARELLGQRWYVSTVYGTIALTERIRELSSADALRIQKDDLDEAQIKRIVDMYR